ncbi:MAG TPA: hypothetical protein PKK26_06925 [Candidatus Wallbacteria bacterium]|nr:hypothetical protein [Candidatus Wallbacteria bacterium]
MKKQNSYAFNKKGMAVYIVIVLVAFIALSLSNISILNIGEINQLAKSEALLKAELITRSAFHKFAWNLKSVGFDQRPCKDKAFNEASLIDGFTCELLCYDAEDEPEALDLWIMVKSSNATRAVFYRLKYVETLINKYNSVITTFASFYSVDDFPTSKISPKTPQKILDVLKKQRANMKNKLAIVKSLETTNDINEILQKINAPGGPEILNRVPQTNGGQDAHLAASGLGANQLNDLLSINSLKKTDNAMQLAMVTNIAQKNNAHTGAQTADGQLGGTPPKDSAAQPDSIATPKDNSQQSGGDKPKDSTATQQPDVTSPKDNPAAKPQADTAKPQDTSTPAATTTAALPPKSRGSYIQRFTAAANAFLSNLGFGIKRFTGTATADDQKKANDALKNYVDISTPGSITSSILTGYNSKINNNYQKSTEKTK